jgi:DUF3102 family protein
MDSLDNAADEIARLHGKLDSLANALRAGEILSQVKERLPHGQWLRFIRERTKLSSQTARNYMRLWTRRAELKGVTSLCDAYHFDRLKSVKRHWLKMTKQERQAFVQWIGTWQKQQ